MPDEILFSPELDTVKRHLAVISGLHDFSSNDYLGYSKSSVIRERLINELQSGCSLGSTGSRLLTGHSEQHQKVEEFIASVFSASAALIFSSGYMANLGVTFAFGSRSTTFFSDELNHASLIDGMRLTQAARIIFRHNNLQDLTSRLRQNRATTKIIITESVFSQDGDLAPLDELLDLARSFGAWLVIDEAHATGIFGSRGLGLSENLRGYDRLITLHACGKALGAQGAFVVCSKAFKDLMINRSRSFIFSTALSPLSVMQIQFALELMISDLASRVRLHKNIRLFNNALGSVSSHIVPIILGSNERVLAAQHALKSVGYDIRAIRSPTVAPGTERLRITLKSFHDEATLNDVATQLKQLRPDQ